MRTPGSSPAARNRRAASLLDAYEPMLLDEGSEPFDDAAWSFEVKHDGHRLLAGVRGPSVQLRTRHGALATPWFPELTAALKGLDARGLVLDGEVCVLDEAGRADFERLRQRLRQPLTLHSEPVVFWVFDVLASEGRRLIDLPLSSRRERLGRLEGLPGLRVVPWVVGDGVALYGQAVRDGEEGIVAKRLASPYAPGDRSSDWMKVKVPRPQLAERFKRFPSI